MQEYNIAQIEARKEWEKARKAAAFEEVLSIIGLGNKELLSFEEVQKSLRLTQRNYRGLQDIPLDQIRGSVGRYRDFTRTFLPRSENMQQRWEAVSAASYERGLEPIEVYKVGDAYFVLDGNHRVSIAKQMGAQTIHAHVWEFPTPVGLSGQADLDEVLIRAEYRAFLDQTHLDDLRPEQNIVFTAPGRYRQLEYQIGLYQKVLERIDGQPTSYEDSVTAWYDMVYTPAVQIIKEKGALERFPGRTEADLFIWIWQRHQEMLDFQGHGRLADTTDEVTQPFLKQMARRVRGVFGSKK